MSRSYELGVAQELPLDEAFVWVRWEVDYEVYEVAFDYWTPGAMYPRLHEITHDDGRQLHAGDRYELFGYNPKNSDILYVRPEGKRGTSHGIAIDRSGYVKGGWIDEHGDTVRFENSAVVLPAFHSDPWTAERLFVKSGTTSRMDTTFLAYLKYSGVEGSVLHLTYGESSGPLGSKRVTEQIQHDLAKSDTLTIKSLQIRVFEATGAKLVFSIIEDGGLQWVHP